VLTSRATLMLTISARRFQILARNGRRTTPGARASVCSGAVWCPV
jgi:hypothetical protein